MNKLQPCDKELWAFGDVVGIYAANCGAVEFERAVNAASTLTEEHLDWHYAAGRAIVKCKEGRKKRVKETVDLMVELKEKYAAQPEQHQK